MRAAPQYVIGKNSVKELLKLAPKRILSIYTSHKNEDPLIIELGKLKKQVFQKNTKKLDDLVNSTSHQGYVLEVTPRETHYIEDFIEKANTKTHSLIVMLDSIFDPQNVGTILRACECFGVDGVIYSKNKGCKITPSVTKTSVGASEIVPIAPVSNLSATVEKFQKNDFWVATAEISDKAISLHEFNYPEKTLLILGSEGKGVQNILSKKADFHVYIPMLGTIDSLNVSQATAVLLNGYNQTHAKKNR